MANPLDKKFDLIAGAEDKLLSGLKGVDQQLAKEILKIYAKFVQGGDLVLNTEQLAQLEDSIIAAVAKTDYKLVIDAYIPNFEAIQLLNKQIHEKINEIDITKVLEENTRIANYQSVIESQLRGTPSTIIKALDDNGVMQSVAIRNPSLDQLIDPIAEIIRTDVIMGISFEEATTKILEAITDKQIGLEQWSGQIARDALSQADGITQDAIRKEFDLKYVRYAGTIKDTTRPLCYHMIKNGPVFKYDDLQKELDKFVPNGVPSESTTTFTANGKQQKKGNGIIPGTTAENFIIYRGGYRCRHEIIPAKRPVPESSL